MSGKIFFAISLNLNCTCSMNCPSLSFPSTVLQWKPLLSFIPFVRVSDYTTFDFTLTELVVVASD